MKDLPNLDLLRACAVTTVVVEHILLAYKVMTVGYWQVRWIGVVGVFIFFVHTSLVLMWSLERKPHTLDFYIRRVFRIYPLIVLAIAVTLFFHAPVAGTPEAFFHYAAPTSLKDIFFACLLVPNLRGNYFPIGVMWSLPYEIQMYLGLPLLFFFIRRNFSLWPLMLFWLFTIAACHASFPGIAHNFFLCIPYFLPGVMAYVGFGRHKAFLPSWSLPIALLLLWSAFMANPGWRVADLLCLAVGLGLPSFHQITSRWLISASHFIAKYSYGVYLAHPFSIVLGLYLMPHAPLALQLSVMLASIILFSVASYHLLERPMIRFGSRFAGYIEKRYEQHEHATLQRIPANEIQ